MIIKKNSIINFVCVLDTRGFENITFTNLALYQENALIYANNEENLKMRKFSRRLVLHPCLRSSNHFVQIVFSEIGIYFILFLKSEVF